MKQGKQITTKQRWFRNLAYLFLGAIFGAFCGFFGVSISTLGLPSFVNLDNFLFCLRIITFVIFAGTIYFGIKANKKYHLYNSISDEEEEHFDELYKKCIVTWNMRPYHSMLPYH
ncbi:TPA: hypothetical protein ACGOV5_001993 [Streptococcus suis]